MSSTILVKPQPSTIQSQYMSNRRATYKSPNAPHRTILESYNCNTSNNKTHMEQYRSAVAGITGPPLDNIQQSTSSTTTNYTINTNNVLLGITDTCQSKNNSKPSDTSSKLSPRSTSPNQSSTQSHNKIPLKANHILFGKHCNKINDILGVSTAELQLGDMQPKPYKTLGIHSRHNTAKPHDHDSCITMTTTRNNTYNKRSVLRRKTGPIISNTNNNNNNQQLTRLACELVDLNVNDNTRQRSINPKRHTYTASRSNQSIHNENVNSNNELHSNVRRSRTTIRTSKVKPSNDFNNAISNPPSQLRTNTISRTHSTNKKMHSRSTSISIIRVEPCNNNNELNASNTRLSGVPTVSIQSPSLSIQRLTSDPIIVTPRDLNISMSPSANRHTEQLILEQ